MPRSSDLTRKRILETAYELFYRKGFARVGTDLIALKASITKRTLYYHFESKDALLAAVLEFHHDLALVRIRRWAERLSGDTDAMIDALFRDLANWTSKARWSGAGFTRVVMELADQPGHPARAIARDHKAAVEAWLRDELAKSNITSPDVRARQVMLLLEGAMSLILIHGNRRYADAAAEAAKDLIKHRRRKVARFRMSPMS